MGQTEKGKALLPSVESLKPRKLELRPVNLKGGNAEVLFEGSAAFGGDGSVEVAGGELPPMADWSEPGEIAFGFLVGVEEGVGPNKSRVYRLHLPQVTATIGVWGTTTIDRGFDQLAPKPGDQVAFIYLGEADTKRGASPVKLFRVQVKRANGSQAVAK